jgi:hypothetical protein
MSLFFVLGSPRFEISHPAAAALYKQKRHRRADWLTDSVSGVIWTMKRSKLGLQIQLFSVLTSYNTRFIFLAKSLSSACL